MENHKPPHVIRARRNDKFAFFRPNNLEQTKHGTLRATARIRLSTPAQPWFLINAQTDLCPQPWPYHHENRGAANKNSPADAKLEQTNAHRAAYYFAGRNHFHPLTPGIRGPRWITQCSGRVVCCIYLRWALALRYFVRVYNCFKHLQPALLSIVMKSTASSLQE